MVGEGALIHLSLCQIVLSLGYCALCSQQMGSSGSRVISHPGLSRTEEVDMRFKVLKSRTVLGKSGQVGGPVRKPIKFSMV